MLIDRVHIFVQAGSGGNGCESYYRRTDKKIVPHGGDGGNGGSIILEANLNAPSLASFRSRQHLLAESGGHGSSSRKRGKNGEDLLVYVPLGTRIFDRKRDLLIRYLMKPGEQVVVVKGGRGGSGNFGGKQSTQGEKGEVLELDLSFRLIADFFFLGLPNSGKSALMNRLSRVHIKEEDYPFSTKSPVIGMHVYNDYEQLTLCEFPSIYQNSHEGRGLGTDFLKHLEDARMVFYMLDPVTAFAENLAEGLKILEAEVAVFQKDFLDIPSAVIVNKMDLPAAKEAVKKHPFDPGRPCFYISAKTGEGVDALASFMHEKKMGWGDA